MTTRSLALAAALAAAALATAACPSTGGKGDGAGGGSSVGGDLHDVLPTDIVRVAKLDHAPDGRTTYVLENISGKLQEDLTYHVEFHYESKTAGGPIGIADDLELSPERDLVLLKGDVAKPIVVENPRPGHAVKATTIAVQSSPPIAAVARDANNAGTFFVNHSLECVGMASEDEIRAGSLWIEVENVSDRPVTELEARAVFVDQFTREETAKTKWTAVKDLSRRGARSRIAFDLGGLGKVGALSFLVKIRQQSL